MVWSVSLSNDKLAETSNCAAFPSNISATCIGYDPKSTLPPLAWTVDSLCIIVCQI